MSEKKILYITLRSDLGGGPKHLLDLIKQKGRILSTMCDASKEKVKLMIKEKFKNLF